MDSDEKEAGEHLLRTTPWVIDELSNVGLEIPAAFDHMFPKDPSLRTKHYVIGARSPFIYKGPSVQIPNQLKDTPFRSSAIDSMDSMDAIGTVCTYAVYAGHYSINGSYMLQGGAISAIFDYATACIGTTLFNPGSFALTKSVTTKFLRGANPVPGIFKVVCEVIALDLNAGSMTLKSSLTNVSSFFNFKMVTCCVVVFVFFLNTNTADMFSLFVCLFVLWFGVESYQGRRKAICSVRMCDD